MEHKFGKFIAEKRKLKKKDNGKSYTQKDLAEEVETTYGFIGQIETGKTFPSEDNIPKYAKVLGIKSQELLDLLKETKQEKQDKEIPFPKGFNEKFRKMTEEGLVRENLNYTIQLKEITGLEIKDKFNGVIEIEYDIKNYSEKDKEVKLYYFFNDDNILKVPAIRNQQETEFYIKKGRDHKPITFYKPGGVDTVNYSRANNEEGDLTLKSGETKTYRTISTRQFDYHDFEHAFTIYPTIEFTFKLTHPLDKNLSVFAERLSAEKTYSSDSYNFIPSEHEDKKNNIKTLIWEFKQLSNKKDSNEFEWEYMLPYEGLRLWWKVRNE